MDEFQEANKELEIYRKRNNLKRNKRIEEIQKKIPEYEIITRKIKTMISEYLNATLNNEMGEKERITQEIERLKNKREKLLIKNGFNKHYLEIEHNCYICKDTGEIKGEICKCKKDIISKLRIKKAGMYQAIANENFETFNLDIFRDTKKGEEPISPQDLMKIYIDDFKEYVDNFTTKSDSIYMSGNVGLGKTFLCNAISGAIIKKGFNVIYMTAPELTRQLRTRQYSPFD